MNSNPTNVSQRTRSRLGCRPPQPQKQPVIINIDSDSEEENQKNAISDPNDANCKVESEVIHENRTGNDDINLVPESSPSENFTDSVEELHEEDDKCCTFSEVSSCENRDERLVKKKRLGLEVLLSASKEQVKSETRKITPESSNIFLRTRSRTKANIPEKWKNLGSLSNPYCVDEEDEVDYSSESNDEKGSREDDRGIYKLHKRKSKVKVGVNRRVKFKKRNRVDEKMLEAEILKILADNNWYDDTNCPENSVDDDRSKSKEFSLPLIFSFGDDESEVVEKSEHEKEIDELWADFDFAMEACNIGSYNDDEGQSEDINEPEFESDQSFLCPKGTHQLTLDEQIGIKCTRCSYLHMDIKHILPPWASSTNEGFTHYTDHHNEDSTFFEDLINDEKLETSQNSHIYSKNSTSTVWDLMPGTRDGLFPHQVEAFEFMWNNLAGTIHIKDLRSNINSEKNGGCVISHAPGTGKTRLSIVFIQSFIKFFPNSRPAVVSPSGLIQTWKNEFKKWGSNVKVHDLNDDKEHAAAQENDGVAPNVQDACLLKLLSWKKGNSVILISYTLLQRRSDLSKIILEKAGLVVFDEGHTPRNDQSCIWKTLKQLKTLNRVLLSGTPFQNNFTELYNTLCLVRPKFEEKLSTLANSSAKSKWEELTRSGYTNDNDMKLSIEEVKSTISPFVHVHSNKILDRTLPGLSKCVVVLNPCKLQKTMLEKIKGLKRKFWLENDYRNSLISIHPSLAMTFLSEEEKLHYNSDMLEEVRLNPDKGSKTKFVIELIRLCEALKEKVIVFCQNLEPLDLLEEQLRKLFSWNDGKEILRMHGKIPVKNRQSLIDDFNDDMSKSKVMLASTKACSEGISLVGGSRVVLLDILWNPSVRNQAISRAYRIGQKRFVYVYQLVSDGMEEKYRYNVQAAKEKISEMVLSKKNDGGKPCENDMVLEEMMRNDKVKDDFCKICYLTDENSNAFAYDEDGLGI